MTNGCMEFFLAPSAWPAWPDQLFKLQASRHRQRPGCICTCSCTPVCHMRRFEATFRHLHCHSPLLTDMALRLHICRDAEQEAGQPGRAVQGFVVSIVVCRAHT